MVRRSRTEGSAHFNSFCNMGDLVGLFHMRGPHSHTNPAYLTSPLSITSLSLFEKIERRSEGGAAHRVTFFAVA